MKTTFKPGDIVMWIYPNKDYSVYYGAKAKVIDDMGEYCLMKIEWVRDYDNIELINGQMDGGYSKSNFQLV